MEHRPYCGWLRNPAPVENGGLSLIYIYGFNHPFCGLADFATSPGFANMLVI